MITALAIENYRSLRSLVLPLSELTVITGPNGSGKSSVYRSLRLLAEASRNGASAALAREGGLPSTLWAGPETVSAGMRSGEVPIQGTRRKGPISLKLGFASDGFSYAIDFGHPVNPGPTMFALDPVIKQESVWSGPVLRPATLLTDRKNSMVRVRDASGEWAAHEHKIRAHDSMLSEFADPRLAPELLALREQIRSWRFYDHFRTDQGSPARNPQIGTITPVLAADGSDLAAALQTIRELATNGALESAVEAAFPGSSIEIDDNGGWFSLGMRQSGLLRPLAASELSDGTLRYLLWIAALLSPRPPALLVLNEPETSLHPALLEPLGELIAAASTRSQLIVVSHSAQLIAAMERAGGLVHELEKRAGETRLVGQGLLDGPPWSWPKR